MVIQPSDRVAEVLRQDERLLEILIGISPVFEGLRNPLLRRTMGRVATVEQAARVAGVDPEMLAERLNRALRGHAPAAPAAREVPGARSLPEREGPSSTMPASLAAIPAERVVDLDVREDLRRGQEPFSRIMAARKEVSEGGVLRLRAIFEPVPLYAVMAKQGFDHWTEQLAEDDWRVWFHPSAGPDDAPDRMPASDGAPSEGGDGVIVLDVRGMEPPEPMVRTLSALETLPPGGTLLQINERVPAFLLPRLAELGFEHQVREQEEGVVRVFIRRREPA